MPTMVARQFPGTYRISGTTQGSTSQGGRVFTSIGSTASLHQAAQILIGSTKAATTTFDPSASLQWLGGFLRNLEEAGLLSNEVVDIPLPSRPSFSAGHRVPELEWHRAHQQELRQYAGQWVVLEGETLVAHGEDLRRVIVEARAKGVAVPYVFYVEPPGEDIVRIGL